jgi:hypothetical protein
MSGPVHACTFVRLAYCVLCRENSHKILHEASQSTQVREPCGALINLLHVK